MRALFGIALAVGAVLARPAQAATKLLKVSELCSVAIDGVPLKQGEIIAEEATLRAFLQDNATVAVHSCNALLAAGPGESQLDYVMTHETTEIAMAMPPGHVLVRNLAGADVLFLVAATPSAATAAALVPPPPTPPPPLEPPPAVSPGSVQDSDRVCELDAEVCISKDGKISTTLSCGAFEVTVESDGEDTDVSMGVTAVNIQIGGH